MPATYEYAGNVSAREGEPLAPSTHASSSNEDPSSQAATDLIDDLLDYRFAGDPTQFVDRLPGHLRALENLSKRRTRTLAGVRLPCFAGGAFVGRLLAIEEIARQVDLYERRGAALNSEVVSTATSESSLTLTRLLARTGEFGAIVVMLWNVWDACQLLKQHSQGQEARLLLGLVREAIAVALHLRLFRDVRADIQLVNRIRALRLEQLRAIPDWNLDDPDGSLMLIGARYRALEQQGNSLLRGRQAAGSNAVADLASFLLGLLSLMLVGRVMSSAAMALTR